MKKVAVSSMLQLVPDISDCPGEFTWKLHKKVDGSYQEYKQLSDITYQGTKVKDKICNFK